MKRIIVCICIVLLTPALNRAQTSEVKVLFSVNGSPKKIENLSVVIFDEYKRKDLASMATKGCRIVVNNRATLPSSFTVKITIGKYMLAFPGLTLKQFDTEWAIDVTDPVLNGNPDKEKSKHRLIEQYSITFRPANAEGTYQLIEIFDQE